MPSEMRLKTVQPAFSEDVRRSLLDEAVKSLLLRGPQGEAGERGPQGPAGLSVKGDIGPRGERGAEGPMGPMPKHEWDGTRLRFELEPDVWGEWVDLRGPQGKAGAGGGMVSLSSNLRWPSGTGQFEGLRLSIPYGAALTVGMPVRLNASGQALRADADATNAYPCIGLALKAASSGTHKIGLQGLYRDDAATWTVGGPDGTIWLSTTGTLTQTQPGDTDDVVQALGYAVTPTVLYFDPSRDYINHA